MPDSSSEGGPPRLARWTLRRILERVHGRSAAQVDEGLDELFRLRRERDGFASARRWYWRQVLGFLLRGRSLRKDRSGVGRGWSVWLRAAPASWATEAKLAMRALRRAPGFAAVAIVSLAFGIAANATVFSAIDVALFKPLPYPAAERLVTVRQWLPERGYDRDPTFAEFRSWQAGTRAAADTLVAWQGRRADLTGADSFDVDISAQVVSLEFLPLLGAETMRGRGFVVADYRADAPPVVIISHDFWQNRFGGATDVLGRTLEIDRTAHTIVGVLSPGFIFDFERDISLPLRSQGAGPFAVDADDGVEVAARLRDGAVSEQLVAELAAIETPVVTGDQGTGEAAVPVVEPLRAMLGWVLVNLAPLLLVVGFVVVLVCANLAGIVLVRTTNRRRELMVRAALGAGRWRLARLVITEILMIVTAAAVLATLLTWWGIDVMVQVDFLRIRHAGPVFDHRSVVFVIGLALLAGFLAGLRPAYAAIRADSGTALRQGDVNATRGRAHALTQHALVVFQVACSLVLLIGAGLVTKTVLRMQQQDPGYEPANLLNADVTFPDEAFGATPERLALVHDLLDRMRSVPGVVAASASAAGGNLHFRVTDTEGGVTLEGNTERLAAEINELSGYTYVSPAYFETLRLPVLRGRTFARADAQGAAPAAIVNEEAARRWWPEAGGDVLGRRFKLGPPSAAVPWITVVGVSGTTLSQILPPRPHVYLPLAQKESLGSTDFHVRTLGEPLGVFPSLRATVADAHPQLWLEDPVDVAASRAWRVDYERRNATVLVAFAAFGLLLAALGIYGVVAYGVSRRTREIGVRMALGAGSAQVLRTVARESVLLAGVGIVVGIALAAALTRLLESMLYGVSPLDPVVFAVVSLVLGLVVMIATWLPARRALQVDPMVALRL